MYEAFEAYLKEKELSANTVKSYLCAIKQYNGRYPVLSRKNLRDYKVFLIENYKPQTVNL